MSAAGTPSTDPWVVMPRERVRYEEQFKSLNPNNGIITGEQAKGFLLQSQLPPMVLGQIWGLADTDADGKMDINEFSIACKLINLRLRGFEIPKVAPPALLASLKVHSPPAMSVVPGSVAPITAPPRPEPPKMQPSLPVQPLIQPNMVQTTPILSNLSGSTITQPQTSSVIPTGIVPPLQSNIPLVQSAMPTGVTTFQNNVAPVQPVMGGIPSIQSTSIPPMTMPPIGIPPVTASSVQSGFTQPVVPGTTPPSIPPMPMNIVPPMVSGTCVMPSNVATTMPGVVPISSATQISPVGSVTGSLTGSIAGSTTGISATTVGPPPVTSSTPRASVTSIGSLDRSTMDIQTEWAVPHQTKLKYTQIFNTTDRTRSGFLSGAQARNVMVQTKLPQNILAIIWALSDMDSDGRLGCEEFVLAMHLCEQAAIGNLPPTVLPADLIPPSFRRVGRTASISSQGSAPQEQDAGSSVSQTTFEDKRKENFEKGQAELERRRRALVDQQRKEAEERERKERDELEKKEKARLEAVKRRMDELEKQMREQQEQERLKEEERKRQAEQRESARKEMERQRQLEWEKQRLQELQQQRQREQENVLKLKAKNQSLTIELSSLNEQVKALSQKICDTRIGVSNVKTTIDGMRSTRDSQMQDMSQLKNKLKEQNSKLLALSQEKVKLDAKNKLNAQMNDPQSEQAKQAFENKEITIKNLKEKIEDMQNQIDGKMSDIENNNSQLTDLKTQLMELVNECESLYGVYEDRKTKVLELKNSNKNVDFSSAWKDTTSAWGDDNTTQNDNNWQTDNWATTAPSNATVADDSSTTVGNVCKYRALYEFVARNSDEVSFQPGDIINVPYEQTGEPGWLAGEIRGHTGWFPESYVEPLDEVGVRDTSAAEPTDKYVEESTTRLEGIAEVPETSLEITTSTTITQNITEPVSTIPETLPEEVEYYIASYPYQSVEQGDLTFNAGEIITVVKKDGDWWTGKIGENVGIFPSNYVQKYDAAQAATTNETITTPITTAPTVSQQDTVNANSQIDNEVSQINETRKELEKAIDSSSSSNTQTLRGKKPEIASVIAPYQASSPEQLSLQRGQLIMIRKKAESGWWEGELQAKGRKRQVGWFPASYVKVLNSTGRISGRTTPVSTTRIQQEVIIDKVVALFPYTAANPDELSFLKDDIISVTSREEQAWWRGELNGVSGLFPSNYVTPLTQQYECNANDKMRQECINELIQTEKAYIEDMSIVHKVFEVPMRDSRVVSKTDVDRIFVNWQELIDSNKEFLRDILHRTDSGSDIIGDVICNHLPRMTAYIKFCSKQLESAALLQNLSETSVAFREFVKKCQNNVVTRGMPLSSFLIKPMQRITKYPLLISKILENTPETHLDHKFLQEALDASDKFLKSINETVRLKENEERLEWLQEYVQNDLNIKFNSCTNKLGSRKLLHYGTLTKVKSGKELIAFLMNDLFLLVQPSKTFYTQFNFQRNTSVIYKMYKQPIFVNDLVASKASTENVESGTDANRVLKVQDKKQTISLLAPTINECNLWLKRIDNAKEIYKKALNFNKVRPKSKTSVGVSCGRLLVLIQKGKRFIRAGKSYSDNVYCKVSLGEQEQYTDVAKDNLLNGNVPQNGAPQVPTLIWNSTMQFPIRNINHEILKIDVYEMCLFTPDEFLGQAEIKISDIYQELSNKNGPITKKLILHQVESGEVEVKLDLQMFQKLY